MNLRMMRYSTFSKSVSRKKLSFTKTELSESTMQKLLNKRSG